jgi:hypothetical protein
LINCSIDRSIFFFFFLFTWKKNARLPADTAAPQAGRMVPSTLEVGMPACTAQSLLVDGWLMVVVVVVGLDDGDDGVTVVMDVDGDGGVVVTW